MQCVCRTRHGLIWTNAIETAHEDITELKRIQTMLNETRCNLETRVLLQSDHVDGDNRNIRITGFDQRTADEADVVGCTASTTSLGNQDSCLCHIVLA